MEDVLEVYQQPYDPIHPQVCLDEAAKQLLGEVRAPLPMRPGSPERVDFAAVVKTLCDELDPAAERIVLVMDQLNTHNTASLYEAYPPAEARRLAERLEIHHPPKHGSWLNMAEIELSVLARQCLDERMENQEKLTRAVDAWERTRNTAAKHIDWRFTTADARIKLKRLYPQPLP